MERAYDVRTRANDAKSVTVLSNTLFTSSISATSSMTTFVHRSNPMAWPQALKYPSRVIRL